MEGTTPTALYVHPLPPGSTAAVPMPQSQEAAPISTFSQPPVGAQVAPSGQKEGIKASQEENGVRASAATGGAEVGGKGVGDDVQAEYAEGGGGETGFYVGDGGAGNKMDAVEFGEEDERNNPTAEETGFGVHDNVATYGHNNDDKNGVNVGMGGGSGNGGEGGVVEEGTNKEDDDLDAASAGRLRKIVERFGNRVQGNEIKKPPPMPKGRGTAIEDMPNVAEKLSRLTRNSPIVGHVHNLIFGGKSKKSELKPQLLGFSGIPDNDTLEKVTARLDGRRWPVALMKEAMDLLEIPRSASSFTEAKNPDRSMLTTRLLEWLQKPVPSGLEPPGPKKRKSVGTKGKNPATAPPKKKTKVAKTASTTKIAKSKPTTKTTKKASPITITSGVKKASASGSSAKKTSPNATKKSSAAKKTPAHASAKKPPASKKTTASAKNPSALTKKSPASSPKKVSASSPKKALASSPKKALAASKKTAASSSSKKVASAASSKKASPASGKKAAPGKKAPAGKAAASGKKTAAKASPAKVKASLAKTVKTTKTAASKKKANATASSPTKKPAVAKKSTKKSPLVTKKSKVGASATAAAAAAKAKPVKKKKGDAFSASAGMLSKRKSSGDAGGNKASPKRAKPAKAKVSKKRKAEEAVKEVVEDDYLERVVDEGQEGGEGMFAAGPSGGELRAKVEEIIADSNDVPNLTFKMMKSQLEEHFEVPLADRKSELIDILSETMP